MTAQELDAWIERHGLTRESAAKVLGTSTSQIFRYLSSECPIPKPIQAVCRAIDRHPDLMWMMP